MPELFPTIKRQGIGTISVMGFKSHIAGSSVEIAPLTVLAGANSSGKSSFLQPLLLLKQTLEAAHDPGTISLNGDHCHYTSTDQFFSRKGKSQKNYVKQFEVAFGFPSGSSAKLHFGLDVGKKAILTKTEITNKNQIAVFHDGMDDKQIRNELTKLPDSRFKHFAKEKTFAFSIARNRFLHEVALSSNDTDGALEFFRTPIATELRELILSVIHLPGLRGTPERTYPLVGAGPIFPGTFEKYTASVIMHLKEKSPLKLANIWKALERIGLTWKVDAREVDQSNIELTVGRLPKADIGGASDVVNIVDVGIGVSQTLPIIVALEVAGPGQMVFVEQPEIHLHPRAQKELGKIMLSAARRGVNVVVETHSSLLIRSIQTLVASGELDPNDTAFYWFKRDPKSGNSKVTEAEVDAYGNLGEWPIDFDDVEMESESEYLDSVEVRSKK